MILSITSPATSISISRPRASQAGIAGAIIVQLARPLHALLHEPSLIFIVVLAVMLFRPPDVQFYSLIEWPY